MKATRQWQSVIHPTFSYHYKKIIEDPLFAKSLSIHPINNECIVSNGQELLVVNPNGEILKKLKGHKDTIITLSHSPDGQYFASGGADKYVILYDSKSHSAFLKYSHSETVSCLSFNPVNSNLLSCSSTDFALWKGLNHKGVVKQKVIPS